MNLDEQVAYYQQHPPSCLDEFVVRPAALPGVEFDGHGFSGKYPDGLVESPNIVFHIACDCGGEYFILLAETDDMAERYALRCLSCGKQATVFDSTAHGYDAVAMRPELGWDDTTDIFVEGEGDAGAATGTCSCCAGQALSVFVRLEYSAYTFEESDAPANRQNLFSWFTLVGKCARCSELTTLADHECM